MSSEQDDKAFMKSFGGVMLLLTVGAIIIAALAMFASTFDPSPRQARIELERQRAEQRLLPVGEVRENGDAPPMAMAEEDDEAEDDVVRTGSEIYESTCTTCHGQGVMDAPVSGENEVWASLYEEKGLDGLVESAIDGIGAMPARGGDSSLSDEEVQNAVVYILEESGVDVDE